MNKVFPAKPHKAQGGFVENLTPPPKRLVQPALGAPKQFNTGMLAKDAIRQLGIGDTCVLLLDPMDPDSYKLGDQIWQDISGQVRSDLTNQSADGFLLGSTASVETIDPEFNPRGYFEYDGTQYFFYNSTNETWMENLHKDGAISTLVSEYHSNGTAIPRGLGTASICNDVGGNYGPSIYETDNAACGDGHEVSQAITGDLNTQGILNKWHIGGYSMSENGGAVSYFFVDSLYGTPANWNSASAPSAAAATYTCKIGNNGGASAPSAAGTKQGFLMLFSIQIAQSDLKKLFHLLRGRRSI